MNEFPFQRFLDLVSWDQQINSREQQIVILRKQVTEVEHELAVHGQSLERTKLSMHEARKAVDVFELHMKGYEEQLREKAKKLESVESGREYDSINRELDHIKKIQHNLEEEIIGAWKTLDIATKEYETKKEVAGEKNKVLEAKMYDLMQKIQELSGELQSLEGQRILKEKNIPEEWLEKYNMMKKQVPNPVVSIHKDSCSACFYKIPQHDLIELRKCKMVQCKDCYRFLYFEPCAGQQVS
jgi:uncharacterized protein